MEEIRSKIDSETTYKVTDKQITVSRGGDSLRISFENLEETIRVFREDIKAEILAIRDAKKGSNCPVCDTFFFAKGNRKYCCRECAKLANIQRSKDWRVKNKEIEKTKPEIRGINEICKVAKELGMSYGQYQAMRYKETLRW